MKKLIIKNIICILTLAFLIVAFTFIAILNSKWIEIEGYLHYTAGHILDTARSFERQMCYLHIPMIFIGITAGINFIIIILINSRAIKDLGCFKPMLAKIEAMKQARNEAKAEKAVVDKQARIAKLEKELEELKKD